MGARQLVVSSVGGGGDVDVDILLHRNESRYAWISNLNPSLNRPNDLTVLLGKFSADMVLDIDLGDEGWCSGFGVGFRFSTRWGLAQHTQGNNPITPRCMTFGSAAPWMLSGADPQVCEREHACARGDRRAGGQF